MLLTQPTHGPASSRRASAACGPPARSQHLRPCHNARHKDSAPSAAAALPGASGLRRQSPGHECLQPWQAGHTPVQQQPTLHQVPSTAGTECAAAECVVQCTNTMMQCSCMKRLQHTGLRGINHLGAVTISQLQHCQHAACSYRLHHGMQRVH
jgi:hypothetical protein